MPLTKQSPDMDEGASATSASASASASAAASTAAAAARTASLANPPTITTTPPPGTTAGAATTGAATTNGNGVAAGSNGTRPRRGSFSFLRRSKSTELKASNRGSKKLQQQQKAQAQAQQNASNQIEPQVPRLPSHPPLPEIKTFGGDGARQAFSYIEPRSAGVGNSRNSSNNNQASAGRNFSSLSHRRYEGGPLTAAGGRPSIDSNYKMSLTSTVPIPPIPGNADGDGNMAESMAHRGRYSYASSAISTINSPRRVRRRKDPTPFNILVIGSKNCGKTSFIDFLRNSLAMPATKRPQTPPPKAHQPANSPFRSHYLETEIDAERIGLTIWDSKGLERNVVDLQLREMAAFIESKFEETFTEEQKVVRSPGARDTHIHCVFHILDPVRLDSNIALSRRGKNLDANSTPIQLVAGQSHVTAGLDDDLDLQVLRTLQGKTTVIPVISKADTVTAVRMAFLKKTVWESLKRAKLDPLEALNVDESEDEDTYESAKSDTHEDDEEHDARKESIQASPGDREDDRSKQISTAPVSEATSAAAAAAATAGTGPGGVSGHRRSTSSMSITLAGSNETETPYLPLSILSPDIYPTLPHQQQVNSPPTGKVGRAFPWGFADPFDPGHCDFVRLRDSVFSEWRIELRAVARERWYEGWRTSRLKRWGGSPAATNANVVSVSSSPHVGGRTSAADSHTTARTASVGPARGAGPGTGLGADGVAGLASASRRPRTERGYLSGLSQNPVEAVEKAGGSRSGKSASVQAY